jgi:hypothetical protein
MYESYKITLRNETIHVSTIYRDMNKNSKIKIVYHSHIPFNYLACIVIHIFLAIVQQLKRTIGVMGERITVIIIIIILVLIILIVVIFICASINRCLLRLL